MFAASSTCLDLSACFVPSPSYPHRWVPIIVSSPSCRCHCIIIIVSSLLYPHHCILTIVSSPMYPHRCVFSFVPLPLGPHHYVLTFVFGPISVPGSSLSVILLCRNTFSRSSTHHPCHQQCYSSIYKRSHSYCAISFQSIHPQCKDYDVSILSTKTTIPINNGYH